MSFHDDEILTHSLKIDLSILSVNLSYVRFIYPEIFKKLSSGGLEVSFSIFCIENVMGKFVEGCLQ